MYLSSVLVNYLMSGFCIIEFCVLESGSLDEVRVVKSSGNMFDQVVLNGLQEIDLEGILPEKNDPNARFRLPIYFKSNS